MERGDSKEAQGRRLRLARERLGLETATAGWEHVRSATRAQIASTSYLQHENGTRSLRGKAQIYAQAFNVPAGWLTWGHAPPAWVDNEIDPDIDGLTYVNLEVRPLDVRYEVKAGLWQEVGSEEPIEQTKRGVMPIAKYSQWSQWLEKVSGDSANLRVPSGFYVHVVDAIEMGYRPKTDDWVVVERIRDQGATRERTLKQVEITDDGQTLLWPRSTNPKWNKPVEPTEGCRPGDDTIEVRIVAKVIAAIDPNFD